MILIGQKVNLIVIKPLPYTACFILRIVLKVRSVILAEGEIKLACAEFESQINANLLKQP